MPDLSCPALPRSVSDMLGQWVGSSTEGKIHFGPSIGDSSCSTTKEKVVSFPAEAFVRIDARQSAHGTMALIGGEWAFRCYFESSKGLLQKILWMTGANRGRISRIPNEVALAIVHEYAFEVRLRDPGSVRPEYQMKSGAIEITPGGGAEFWGEILGSPEHLYTFRLDGKDMTEGERQKPMLASSSYEVWLQKDGKVIGDAPLFAVGYE